MSLHQIRTAATPITKHSLHCSCAVQRNNWEVFVRLGHMVHLGMKRSLLLILPHRLPYPRPTVQPRWVTGRCYHQIQRKLWFLFRPSLKSEVNYLLSIVSVCTVACDQLPKF